MFCFKKAPLRWVDIPSWGLTRIFEILAVSARHCQTVFFPSWASASQISSLCDRWLKPVTLPMRWCSWRMRLELGSATLYGRISLNPLSSYICFCICRATIQTEFITFKTTLLAGDQALDASQRYNRGLWQRNCFVYTDSVSSQRIELSPEEDKSTPNAWRRIPAFLVLCVVGNTWRCFVCAEGCGERICTDHERACCVRRTSNLEFWDSKSSLKTPICRKWGNRRDFQEGSQVALRPSDCKYCRCVSIVDA